MRILVIGAGATGGYFGGRLLESGQDVSFLVRERRAAQLAEHGLVIRSSFGDATLPHPPTVQAGELREAFDLILLSCKAYHLPQVIEDMAPAVGPHTAILPKRGAWGTRREVQVSHITHALKDCGVVPAAPSIT